MKKKLEAEKAKKFEKKKSVMERTDTFTTDEIGDQGTNSLDDGEEAQQVVEEKEDDQYSDDEDFMFRVYFKEDEIQTALE